MNETVADLDEIDDASLAGDVADEALEAAGTAHGKGGAYTVAMCTGGVECPF